MRLSDFPFKGRATFWEVEVSFRVFRVSVYFYFLGFFPCSYTQDDWDKNNVLTNFEGDDFKSHFPCLGKHMSLIMFDRMWTNELWAFKASRVSEDAAVDRE